MTRYLVLSMQRISNLQSDIASMPENLGALDHDLRSGSALAPNQTLH